MKYIMFKVEQEIGNHAIETGSPLTIYVPIIFPNNLTHKTVQKGVFYSVREAYPNCKITTRSAGFWNGDAAHGDSETLELKSHPDDTTIISTYDYTHGLVDDCESPAGDFPAGIFDGDKA